MLPRSQLPKGTFNFYNSNSLTRKSHTITQPPKPMKRFTSGSIYHPFLQTHVLTKLHWFFCLKDSIDLIKNDLEQNFGPD